MSEFLRSWVLSLTGAALLSAFALALTPQGRARSAVRLVCGVVTAIALVSPVLDFDFESYSMSLAAYRSAADQAAARLEETNDRLSRTIIEEECAAYILDKAQVLGLEMESASVTAKWGDADCWYPYEARLRAGGDELARRYLSDLISSELGIAPERQYWEDMAPQGDG